MNKDGKTDLPMDRHKHIEVCRERDVGKDEHLGYCNPYKIYNI